MSSAISLQRRGEPSRSEAMDQSVSRSSTRCSFNGSRTTLGPTSAGSCPFDVAAASTDTTIRPAGMADHSRGPGNVPALAATPFSGSPDLAGTSDLTSVGSTVAVSIGHTARSVRTGSSMIRRPPGPSWPQTAGVPGAGLAEADAALVLELVLAGVTRPMEESAMVVPTRQAARACRDRLAGRRADERPVSPERTSRNTHTVIQAQEIQATNRATRPKQWETIDGSTDR